MTADEFFTLFERASGATLPSHDRAAAVAGRLQPVFDAVAGGTYLSPRAYATLVTGIYALAAARSDAALPRLIELLQHPDLDIDEWLGKPCDDLAAILVGMHQSGDSGLKALASDAEIEGSIRWTALVSLAWLAREGRLPRQDIVEFLDRFDRQPMAEPGDMVWVGWQDAVLTLGLFDMEPRVLAAWQAGRLPHERQVDKDDWLQRMAEARADPQADPTTMDDFRPLDHPDRNHQWLEVETETGLAESEEPSLSEAEISWLMGFMGSRHWPRTAASIEEMDGYFTGQWLGPAKPDLDLAIAQLWTDDSGTNPPQWADADQEAFVLALIKRHWLGIGEALDAGQPVRRINTAYLPDENARDWATGFAAAIIDSKDAWAPALDNGLAGGMVAAIIGLSIKAPRNRRESRERAKTLELLPSMLLGLRNFWRSPETFPTDYGLNRTAKIGRNDPCPCGSGRKYKKCCANAAAEPAPSALPLLQYGDPSHS